MSDKAEKIETTVRIDGMACGMCEAHVCDALRAKLPGYRISASHGRGTATLIGDAAPDENTVRNALDGTGYRVLGIESAPHRRRGLFGFGRSR